MDKSQDISSLRTSQEPSRPTEEKISKRSSKRSSASSKKKRLRCLRLNRGGGQPPIFWWATDGALLTDYSMRNTGESPNEGVESLLSQILQAAVHPRYYLTAKASRGILLRASARGRELPTVLKLALERQAGESLS